MEKYKFLIGAVMDSTSWLKVNLLMIYKIIF